MNMMTKTTTALREAIYVPGPIRMSDEELLALTDEDLLKFGAEEFDAIRNMNLFIELPNDTIIEPLEATTRPSYWRARVTIGDETRETTIRVLHGRLLHVWRARAQARQRMSKRAAAAREDTNGTRSENLL
jgi:hypothetical protein